MFLFALITQGGAHLCQSIFYGLAKHFDWSYIRSFSGGTEETAVYPSTIKALREIGFNIQIIEEGKNPLYFATIGDDDPGLKLFSKVYNHEINPKENFATVMTCSHADKNCPAILGALKRISLPYEDPKRFDGTSEEMTKYIEKAQEIGSELYWVFSQLKN